MNTAAQLLSALFESAGDAVLVVDDAHTVRLVNQHAETLFGWTQEELAGMPLRALVAPDLQERHEGLVHDFLKQPTNRLMGVGLELWAQHKNGTRIPVDIALSPLRFDQQSFVACAVRNLSAEHPIAPTAASSTAASSTAVAMDQRANESALQTMFGAGLTLSASLEDFGTDASRQRVERAAEDLRSAIADLRTLLQRGGGD